MVSKSSRQSPRKKVQAHRDRLRAQGLRPIQLWVPDVRSPEFKRQAHLQSTAVRLSDCAEEDQAFVDSISEDAFE